MVVDVTMLESCYFKKCSISKDIKHSFKPNIAFLHIVLIEM